MLTKIEVTTAQGAVLTLPLLDSPEGFMVESVDGLDPVKANIVSSSYAQKDGDQYQSSRRGPRDIGIKMNAFLGYGASIRQIRKYLMGYLMPKSLVSLRFYDDEIEPLDIVGRVEVFNFPLFVEDPDVTISIHCESPDFLPLNSIVVSGMTVADSSEILIPYDGEVSSGIILELNANRALPSFSVFHRPSNDSVRTLDFTQPLSAGDKLTISTVPGAKGAILTRAGSDSSLLYGITPYSNWIELEPGDNYLRVYAAGAGIPYNVTYLTRYGGL